MNISSEREYHIALQRVYDLMQADPAADSQEGAELAQLVSAVEQFEGSRFPMTCCAFSAKDCAERLLNLLRQLGAMFDVERAVQWCESPQPLLDGQRPVDMLLTDKGTAEVEQVVARVLAGDQI